GPSDARARFFVRGILPVGPADVPFSCVRRRSRRCQVHTTIKRHLLPLSAVLVCAAPAPADTAASALFRPMLEGSAIEFSATAWGQSEGETEQADLDARISSYEATGRFLLDPDAPGSPTAAISWSQLNTHSSDPALPDELTDISLA